MYKAIKREYEGDFNAVSVAVCQFSGLAARFMTNAHIDRLSVTSDRDETIIAKMPNDAAWRNIVQKNN